MMYIHQNPALTLQELRSPNVILVASMIGGNGATIQTMCNAIKTTKNQVRKALRVLEAVGVTIHRSRAGCRLVKPSTTESVYQLIDIAEEQRGSTRPSMAYLGH